MLKVKLFLYYVLGILFITACKQNFLKPQSLEMNADTQNRELFRWLTEQEARSVIEEMKTSPSFTKRCDTMVSVLAKTGLVFKVYRDSLVSQNPILGNPLNFSNLRELVINAISNNELKKEEIKELAGDYYFQALAYIEEHPILKFVYLEQSLSIVQTAFLEYIQGNSKYNDSGENLVINTVGNCVLEAVGVNTLVEVYGGKITQKITKAAVKKVASKAIPVVGWLVAAYDFGSCMSWW